MAWSDGGTTQISTFHTPSPKLSTGGGDNFNAGYCFARLCSFDVRSSLVVAAAVAGFYVSNGSSPTRAEVVDFLKAKSSRSTAPSQEAAE
jgi:sugar/nucleoside kinase (ribokinase family)